MARKGKEATDPEASAMTICSLFSADNPFRRKKGPPEEAPPIPAVPTPAASTPVRKQPKEKLPLVEAYAAEPSRKKQKEEGPPWRKRNRDEVEAGNEQRRLGSAVAPAEDPAPRPVVGKWWKAPDDVVEGAAGLVGEEQVEDEAFDDEGKLLRTDL